MCSFTRCEVFFLNQKFLIHLRNPMNLILSIWAETDKSESYGWDLLNPCISICLYWRSRRFVYERAAIDNFQTSSKENLSSDVRMMSVTKRMTLVSVGFALQWHEMKALISANNVTSPWVSTSVFHTFIDFHSRWTVSLSCWS